VRTQSGTAQLRALLYFDEVSGYLPPVAEPASKRPLLSILKQGRGFGFGALLATQNPVDLDYKALTNAGIWMIGRLQAQRDKDRLLDGLESAGVGLLRAELDRTISGLEKRRFLLHDVHRPGGPVVFESRWVRAYLRGPVSLRELPQLTGEPAAAAPPAARAAASSSPSSAPVPPSLDPVFQHRYSGRGTGAPLAGEVAAWMEARVSRQRPAVAGVARVLVRFGRGPAPQPVLDRETDPESWSSSPPGGAAYGALPAWATAGSSTAGLERLARNAVAGEGLTLDGVPALGLVRAPEEAAEAFAARVRAALGAEAQKRSAKTRGPAARKIETLERRIAEEARELERDRGELSRAKTYSAIDVGASILGTVLGGGKRSVGTAGRAGGRAYGRIQRASEGVKESEQKIAEWTSERDALRSQLEAELAAVRRELEAEAGKVEPVRVPITRADVRALGWYVLWS
jgi:hypothetical protein